MYNICMGMKKIKKLIRKEISEGYSRGWDEGWDQGWASALNSEALNNELFNNGVQAERKRIIGLFKMLSDSEFENGSPNKARAWKDAAEIVKVADELEVYDEEGEYLG